MVGDTSEILELEIHKNTMKRQDMFILKKSYLPILSLLEMYKKYLQIQLHTNARKTLGILTYDNLILLIPLWLEKYFKI